MRKTKREKILEENVNYWKDKTDKYRKKWLFWQPSGMLALIGIIVLFLYVLVQAFLAHPLHQFTITQTLCQNDVISLNNNLICKSSCLLGVSNTLGINDNTNELQRRNLIKDCNAFCDEKMPTEQKCNQTEVKSLVFPFNCLNEGKVGCGILITTSDLTEEFLDENCEGKRCTTCEDLNCKNQKCDLWYCGNYEVTKQ